MQIPLPVLTIGLVKCQTPSKRRTDEETRLFVRPSVRLSLCPLCLSGASILWGERTAMLHRNLREGIKKSGINR